MLVLGVNEMLGWAQILSNGRRYTCVIKEIDGELFFKFKNQWHRVSDYTEK